MSSIDLVVYSALAIAAGFPAIWAAGESLLHWIDGQPVAPSLDKKWVPSLLSLLEGLSRQGDTKGADLCRELLWHLMGGADEQHKAPRK